jgi:ABC-2 type transport system permease protein
MNRTRIINGIADIYWMFYQRCKLIIKDKTIIVILGISVLASVLLIHMLIAAGTKQSALSIGIVDYDRSRGSKQLMEGIKKVNMLNVVEKNEEELKKLLLDEIIMAYFVIKDDYYDKLLMGNVKESITMYYVQDNKAASVISDIVAGEMMYSVCYYKAFCLYEQIAYHGNKHTDVQYKDYMEKLFDKSEDFDFAFQINYVNSKGALAKKDTLNNSVIYNQLIFGILGIFIALTAMFFMAQAVIDKETGVEDRLIIMSISNEKQALGNYMAFLFAEGIIISLFTVLIMLHLHIEDLKLWGSTYLLFFLYAMVNGSIFLLLSKWIKNMMVYQLTVSISILFTGGLGFFALLSGIQTGYFQYLIKIIPNNWFILGFTDIIIYGSEGGYIKQGHCILLIMVFVLSIINTWFLLYRFVMSKIHVQT